MTNLRLDINIDKKGKGMLFFIMYSSISCFFFILVVKYQGSETLKYMNPLQRYNNLCNSLYMNNTTTAYCNLAQTKEQNPKQVLIGLHMVQQDNLAIPGLPSFETLFLNTVYT